MVGLRAWFFSLSAFLVFGPATLAFDDCWPWRGISYAAVHYVIAPPLVYVPVREQARLTCPCVADIRYATPTAAPAAPGPGVLASHEPPLATKPGSKQGPTIQQSRTFGNISQVTESRREKCSVTFWNLTGFDIKLSVNDISNREIAKDRAFTIDLYRNTVTWHTDRNPLAKTEAISDELNYFDVLIK